MERYKKANIASILGIIGNIFLLIIKLIVAITTSSQAMFSDAFNSAGDIFSSLMTFIGNKISKKLPDDDHNLGHGKAEYIFSMLISLSMVIVSLKLVYDSIFSIFNTSQYHFSYYLIVVSLVTITVKFFLFLYTKKIAELYNNLLINANALDHRNDCILSFLTLTSSISAYFGFLFVDGIVGVLVASWILLVGIKLFKDSYDVLMDKGMSEETKAKVLEIVSKYPEIKKINHFNSTPVGYRYQISLTIFVDGNLSTFESHDIADKLEDDISELDEVFLVIIHVNPI